MMEPPSTLAFLWHHRLFRKLAIYFKCEGVYFLKLKFEPNMGGESQREQVLGSHQPWPQPSILNQVILLWAPESCCKMSAPIVHVPQSFVSVGGTTNQHTSPHSQLVATQNLTCAHAPGCNSILRERLVFNFSDLCGVSLNVWHTHCDHDHQRKETLDV